MQIKDGIIDIAIQNIIPIEHNKARPKHKMTPEYITIHNTGNAGTTGKLNSNYVVNQNEYVSWHFTIGCDEVYQHLPIAESAYHAGDGENGDGNRKSIGIEIAEVYGAEKTAVKFVAELIKATGISIGKIVPHKHWSGKNCPRLILPYWDKFIDDVRKEVGNMVEYKKYNDRIHELKSNVEELDVKIVDKKIFNITEYTNCTNGTFYWYDDKGKTYPTSILYADNTIYQDVANHYLRFNAPQSVFVVYKNDTVDMKRIKSISELDLGDIRLVVGGLGLRNNLDTTFKYSPVTEGFKGLYADVLRKTNKTVLGYNKRLNKVYLLTVKNATHAELLSIISDDSTGEAYDIAISLDGGGSTFMDANKEYVFEGQNSRRINNIIGFNLG